MKEPEKQEEIEMHPLWGDYEATLKALKAANKAEDYSLIQPLEDRLTKLTLQIGGDLGLVSANPDPDKP